MQDMVVNMITKEILKQISPSAKEEIIDDLEKYFDKYLQQYKVNTYLRVCHFLAQAAHESAGFKTLEEYASGKAYEGRKDLGNTQPGDGVRYKGRGIFQLTGRANYRDMSKRLGYDLENNPKLASTAEISVLTALEYWNSRKLSQYADEDDVRTVTKRINGGFNGLEDRKLYLARAKKVLKGFDFDHKPNDNPLNVPVAQRGDKSPYVKDLQEMLVRKGYKLVADGDFGPKTEDAVKGFQASNDLNVSGKIDTDTLNKLMV